MDGSIALVEFSTYAPSYLPTAAESCLDVVMYDSDGDGWQGAVLTVTEAGEGTAVFTGSVGVGYGSDDYGRYSYSYSYGSYGYAHARLRLLESNSYDYRLRLLESDSYDYSYGGYDDYTDSLFSFSFSYSSTRPGSLQAASLCLEDGCYLASVSEDSYPSEVSFTIDGYEGSGAPYGPTTFFVSGGGVADWDSSCDSAPPTATPAPSTSPPYELAPTADSAAFCTLYDTTVCWGNYHYFVEVSGSGCTEGKCPAGTIETASFDDYYNVAGCEPCDAGTFSAEGDYQCKTCDAVRACRPWLLCPGNGCLGADPLPRRDELWERLERVFAVRLGNLCVRSGSVFLSAVSPILNDAGRRRHGLLLVPRGLLLLAVRRRSR